MEDGKQEFTFGEDDTAVEMNQSVTTSNAPPIYQPAVAGDAYPSPVMVPGALPIYNPVTGAFGQQPAAYPAPPQNPYVASTAQLYGHPTVSYPAPSATTVPWLFSSVRRLLTRHVISILRAFSISPLLPNHRLLVNRLLINRLLPRPNILRSHPPPCSLLMLSKTGNSTPSRRRHLSEALRWWMLSGVVQRVCNICTFVRLPIPLNLLARCSP